MADCIKLLKKAKDSPNSYSFNDLCRLAECFGFEFSRQEGSSHRIYKLPNSQALPPELRSMNFQEHDGKAKPYQVKLLLKAIRLIEELKAQEEGDERDGEEA